MSERSFHTARSSFSNNNSNNDNLTEENVANLDEVPSVTMNELKNIQYFEDAASQLKKIIAEMKSGLIRLHNDIKGLEEQMKTDKSKVNRYLYEESVRRYNKAYDIYQYYKNLYKEIHEQPIYQLGGRTRRRGRKTRYSKSRRVRR